MTSQMIICLIIFILTLVSFILNRIPMALTALISMMLYYFTGCIDASAALKGFSNTNTILIASMFVVGAGFTRTSYIAKIANGVTRMSSGSFKKAMGGFILLAALLSQFIQSPSAVFVIVFPIVLATCDNMGVSPSKAMFPLGLTCIASCAILPLGSSAATYAQFNGYLEAYKYTTYMFKPWDIAYARIPSLIFVLVYCIFFADRFAPDQPIIPLQTIQGGKIGGKKEPLSKAKDIIGLVIFAVVSVALLLSEVIGIPAWAIALGGALLMLLCGILTEKEAVASIPMSLLLIFVGALATGEALTATGAGKLIGGMFAAIGKGIGNNFLFCALFFLVPFVITQFMNNLGVIGIFTPIAILTAQSLEANPVGLIILVSAASLCAFLTPMGTPTASMIMGLGGYDIKSMFKQGWLPGLILWFINSLWVSIIFPVL